MQGCTVLKDADTIRDMVKVHTVLEKFKADIFRYPLKGVGKIPGWLYNHRWGWTYASQNFFLDCAKEDITLPTQIRVFSAK